MRTYIKIRGQWRYLYRAIDKHGTPVDFLLTAKRDLDAAKRFFRMLEDEPLLSPDRIGTDGAGPYPPAIAAARKDGLRTPLHYVTKHLQRETGAATAHPVPTPEFATRPRISDGQPRPAREDTPT